MKIETKRNEVKTFEPIEIKLTIESQKEFDAYDFWKVVNDVHEVTDYCED